MKPLLQSPTLLQRFCRYWAVAFFLLASGCSTKAPKPLPKAILTDSQPVIDAPAEAHLTHWRNLFLAQQAIAAGEESEAQNLLSSIRPEQASYPDALIASASLDPSVAMRAPTKAPRDFKIWLTEIQRSDLLPQYLINEAIRSEKNNTPELTLRLLQELRSAYPRSTQASEAKARSSALLLSRSQSTALPPEVIFSELKALKVEGDLVSADTLVNQQLQRITPESAAHYELLFSAAEIAQQSGDQNRALALLLRVSKCPDAAMRARANLILAKVEWNKSRSEQALGRLAIVTLERKGSAEASEAHYLMGRIHEESHQLDKALQHYQSVPTGADTYLRALRQSAWIEVRRGRIAEALTRFIALEKAVAGKNSATESELQLRDESVYWQGQLCTQQPNVCKNISPNRRYGLLSEYAILAGKSPLLQVSTAAADAATCQRQIPTELESRLKYLNLQRLESLARHEIHWHYHRLSEEGTGLEKDFAATRSRLLYQAGAYTSAMRFSVRSLLQLVGDTESLSPCTKELISFAYPRPFAEQIQLAAAKYAISPALLFALARTESQFDPLARSGKDAQGLLQLLVSTAKMEGLQPGQSLYDPAVNIELGAKHLASLLAAYPDKRFAIAAYNAGAPSVARWRARFPTLSPQIWSEHIGYQETKDYVRKVTAAEKMYERLLTP